MPTDEYSDDEYIDVSHITCNKNGVNRKDLDIEINEHIYQMQPHSDHIKIIVIGSSNKNIDEVKPLTNFSSKYFEYIVRSVIYTKDRYIQSINNKRIDIIKIDVKKKDNGINIGSIITTFIPSKSYDNESIINGYYQQIFDDGTTIHIIKKNYKYDGNQNIISSMMEFACSDMIEIIS